MHCLRLNTGRYLTADSGLQAFKMSRQGKRGSREAASIPRHEYNGLFLTLAKMTYTSDKTPPTKEAGGIRRPTGSRHLGTTEPQVHIHSSQFICAGTAAHARPRIGSAPFVRHRRSRFVCWKQFGGRCAIDTGAGGAGRRRLHSAWR